MLMGHRPFRHGRTENVYSHVLKQRILNEEIFKDSDRWRELSDDLKDLICGCLQKDRKKRFTIRQIRKHSWLKNFTESTNNPTEVQQAISIENNSGDINESFSKHNNVHKVDQNFSVNEANNLKSKTGALNVNINSKMSRILSISVSSLDTIISQHEIPDNELLINENVNAENMKPTNVNKSNVDNLKENMNDSEISDNSDYFIGFDEFETKEHIKNSRKRLFNLDKLNNELGNIHHLNIFFFLNL